MHLRVTAKAAGEKEAKKLVKPVVKETEKPVWPLYLYDECGYYAGKGGIDLLISNKLPSEYGGVLVPAECCGKAYQCFRVSDCV